MKPLVTQAWEMTIALYCITAAKIQGELDRDMMR
jgi:hypothetical protein